MAHIDSGPKSVLIIDDDDAVRQAITWLLRIDGFEVAAESGDGTEGVALATTLRPAFVIVDNMMPGGMDGATAAGLIRKEVPESKIIVFSGSVEERPPWADALLRKDRITEIGKLLDELAE